MQWKRTNHGCLWEQGRKRDEETPKPASHVDELGAPSSEEWWVETRGIEGGGRSWVGEGVVGEGVGVCALAVVLFLRGVSGVSRAIDGAVERTWGRTSPARSSGSAPLSDLFRLGMVVSSSDVADMSAVRGKRSHRSRSESPLSIRRCLNRRPLD